MTPIVRFALLFASGLAALSGVAGCGGEMLSPPEETPLGSSSAAVTCNPSLRRYPVAGPHNNGYDANWSVFACTPGGSCVSNSDFVAGSHLGNDIFAARGTPVVAPVDGTISYSFTDSTGGNVVYVVDGCGWWYYHAHLDSVAGGLYIGQRVAAGTQIGVVGNTGSAASTSPHLHFSMYPGTYSQGIDPFPYLSAVESTACGGPVTQRNDATVLTGNSSVPGSLAPGEVRSVTVRVQNTGSTTWPANSAYRLGASSSNGLVWSNVSCGGYSSGVTDARAGLCSSVPPGGIYDFTFSVQAPAGGNSALLSARMVQDSVEWFGQTQSWTISISSPVTTTPPQPTGLSPDGWANAGSSSVVLSWSPAAGATSYEVYIVYWDGSAWTYYYTYNPTTNQTTFWPYYHNTYYAWVAKGKNTAGTGPQSAWAYFYFQ
jgi:hypothetical protein